MSADRSAACRFRRHSTYRPHTCSLDCAGCCRCRGRKPQLTYSFPEYGGRPEFRRGQQVYKLNANLDSCQTPLSCAPEELADFLVSGLAKAGVGTADRKKRLRSE